MKPYRARPGIAFFIILACSFVPCKVCGQQPNRLDSLLQAEKAHPKEDLAKLKLWVKIAREYQFSNTTMGFGVADSAIALAKRLHAQGELGYALDAKGQLYYRSGQHNQAITLLGNALTVFKATEDRKGMAYVYTNLGMVYWQISQWKKALEYFNKSIEMAEGVKDEQTIGNAYGNIGIIYYERSDYPKALEYDQKALGIHKQYHNIRGAAQNLQNIGLIYLDQTEYIKAMDYLLQAARINEKLKDLSGLAHNYANLGMIYEKISDYNSALTYYERSKRLCEETGEKFGLYFNLESLGSIKLHVKNYSAALVDFGQALMLADTLGYKKGSAEIYNFTGIIQAALGHWGEAISQYEKATVLFDSLGYKPDLADNLERTAEAISQAPDPVLLEHHISPQRRLNVARSLLKRSLILAKKAGAQNVQENIWKTSSSLYEQEGNIDKAFADYKKFIALRDSLDDNERQKELEFKGIQYEFNRKADSLRFENQLAEAKLQQQTLIARHHLKEQRIYGIGIFLLFIAVAAFLFYRNKMKQSAMKAELEHKMSDAVLSSLHAQMNPHFIFNCLGSIKQMILENEQENANRYLNKFAKMIRLSLEHSRRPYVTIREKLEYLNNYLEMEQLRFNHSFKYKIEIDENIRPDEVTVPPMMIQPLVENAIWHGLMNKENDRELVIRYKLLRNKLVCEIEDNGIGIIKSSQRPKTSHRSIGIENIKHRLNLLNQKYHLDCSLQINDKSELNKSETGTIAILTLPCSNLAVI